MSNRGPESAPVTASDPSAAVGTFGVPGTLGVSGATGGSLGGTAATGFSRLIATVPSATVKVADSLQSDAAGPDEVSVPSASGWLRSMDGAAGRRR